MSWKRLCSTKRCPHESSEAEELNTVITNSERAYLYIAAVLVRCLIIACSGKAVSTVVRL